MTTIEEAKVELRKNLAEGMECPCCTQFVKMYRKAFPSIAARTLIAMSKAETDQDGYVYVAPVVNSLKTKVGIGGAATLSHFWGLIETRPGVREDGSKRVGWWRITPLGRLFLTNQMTVSKYARMFNGELYGMAGPQITISQALGNKFDYSELMKGV